MNEQPTERNEELYVKVTLYFLGDYQHTNYQGYMASHNFSLLERHLANQIAPYSGDPPDLESGLAVWKTSVPATTPSHPPEERFVQTSEQRQGSTSFWFSLEPLP